MLGQTQARGMCACLGESLKPTCTLKPYGGLEQGGKNATSRVRPLGIKSLLCMHQLCDLGHVI